MTVAQIKSAIVAGETIPLKRGQTFLPWQIDGQGRQVVTTPFNAVIVGYSMDGVIIELPPRWWWPFKRRKSRAATKHYLWRWLE